MVASAGTRSGRAPVLAKYEVLEELGHGGMATVYRAHDKRLGRDVAIKVLHPHLRESREIAHRFAVEAKAVAKLRHRNIVEVFDVSSEEDIEQYLVVELVRGPTLRKLLQERGALPPEIGAAIVMELLGGIAHAHASGVVHRDVKPENVLLEHRPTGMLGAPLSSREPMVKVPSSVPTPLPTGGGGTPSNAPSSGSTSKDAPNAGERVSVKLTDFGIAKLLDAQGVTSTGQVLGSPAHMAPEQIEGGDVDGRADVFGLGVLLYECLVGHLPFLGNNPAQVLRRVLDGVYASAERERPTVGKVWSQILDRALARRAEDRFPDATTMRDVIGAELSRLGMSSPRFEIETWLDDPEGWTQAHEKTLIGKLCELGAASRKRGEAVAAAADYNRALAYAPNDPSLLRIVASMHRSERRARFLRRATPLVLGACVLGSGAYFVARAFKAEPRVDPAPRIDPSAPRASASALAGPASAVVSASPSATPAGNASTPATATTRTIANPTVVPSAGRPGVQRTVSFASIRPSFGVHMTIDGNAAPDPAPKQSFVLDDKPHTLVFTCTGDLCTPKTVPIAGGDKDESLTIELAITPAKLVVEGEPGHSYSIEEMPSVILTNGQEIEIPMTNGTRTVTVFDRIDPSKKQPVDIKAGKKVTLPMKGH